MDVTDPILEKVRKLLALAEDPAATPHEAEACTAKATQLMADYGIDRALLATRDPGRDPVRDREVVIDAPYVDDKVDLLTTVATNLRCASVRRTTRDAGRRRRSVHLFGHASDLARTELLFTSLLLQSATALANTPVPVHEHKAAFRRSWLRGFRQAVGARLREAESRAQTGAEDRFRASGTSTSLVLADRTAAVVSAMNAAYPNLSTARPRVLSGSGSRAGWAAGQHADLGGRRVGGGPLPLPRNG